MSDNKVHIFDCDGVLLDSNALKLDALRETLVNVGSPIDFIEWAVEEFRLNFGRTRAEHFKIFAQYNGAKPYKFNSDTIIYAMNYYGKCVEALYKICPVLTETELYISKKTCNGNLFVVSASNENELKRILPFRIPHFGAEAIFGGPVKKSENLKRISDALGADSIIFYGDAIQDAKAAVQVGVLFVGLYGYSADPESLKDYCKKHDLLCFKSCLEIVF